MFDNASFGCAAFVGAEGGKLLAHANSDDYRMVIDAAGFSDQADVVILDGTSMPSWARELLPQWIVMMAQAESRLRPLYQAYQATARFTRDVSHWQDRHEFWREGRYEENMNAAFLWFRAQRREILESIPGIVVVPLPEKVAAE